MVLNGLLVVGVLLLICSRFVWHFSLLVHHWSGERMGSDNYYCRIRLIIKNKLERNFQISKHHLISQREN